MKIGLEAGGWRLGTERASTRRRLLNQESRFADHDSGFSRFTFHVSRAVLALVVLSLAGCSNIEPWVKPYERAAFADPIMSADPNPVSSAYTHHVYEAREGARGAMGSAGGGCGCN